MMEMQTSSPSCRTVGPRVLAMRLSDSLALRVKTTSSPRVAPMWRAMWSRARSMAWVASTDRRYRPRRGLAFIVS